MRHRGFVRWIALATALLAIARYLPVIDRPFGRDHASGNGLYYSGLPIKHWLRFGFDATHGTPLLAALPTDPPIGVVWAHHPPAFLWMTYPVVARVGFTERGFRVLPILLSALSGGLLVLIAGRSMTRVGVTVVGALWLVLPMSFVFGWMCNPEVATLFFILLTVLLHLTLRDRPPRLYSVVLAAHFLAGQMDWEGHFTVPALCLLECLRPRPDRRWGRVFAMAIVSVVSVAVVLVIHGFFVDIDERAVASAYGSHEAVRSFSLAHVGEYLVRGFDVASTTARDASGAAVSSTASAWFGGQVEMLVRFFSWPVVIATAVGILFAAGRMTTSLAVGLAILVPGILNIVVFRSHAAQHDYWTWYLLPGAVLITGDLISRISSRGTPRPRSCSS